MANAILFFYNTPNIMVLLDNPDSPIDPKTINQEECLESVADILHPKAGYNPRTKARIAFAHYMNEAILSGPLSTGNKDPKYIITRSDEECFQLISRSLTNLEESMLCNRPSRTPNFEAEIELGFKMIATNVWRGPLVNHTISGIVSHYQTYLIDSSEDGIDPDPQEFNNLVGQSEPVIEWTMTHIRYYLGQRPEDDFMMFSALQMILNPDLMTNIDRISGRNNRTHDLDEA